MYFVFRQQEFLVMKQEFGGIITDIQDTGVQILHIPYPSVYI